MLNVRAGDWFVERRYEPQRERFISWLHETERRPLLILDVGTGFNTPGVVRWTTERIAMARPDATLVRVNVLHPEVPAELGNRGLGIASTGAALWRALRKP